MKQASQVVLGIKNWPANAEDARDMGSILGWEDPLEQGMASHSDILAQSSTDRGAQRATGHGVAKLNMTEKLNKNKTENFMT